MLCLPLLTALLSLLSSTALAAPTSNVHPRTFPNELVIDYQGNYVFYPGEYLTPADIAIEPSIGTILPLTGTYLLVMFDPDGPSALNDGVPFTILHNIRTNMKPAGLSSDLFNLVGTDIAPYLVPEPLPGCAPLTHQYTFNLYTQPASFVFPAAFDKFLALPTLATPKARFGFNIPDFEVAAGLGSPLLTMYFDSSAAQKATTCTEPA